MRPNPPVRPALIIAGVLTALTLGAAPVQAQYLDPGAGSIIVQAVIAVVVGVAATVKLYWGRISGFLSRRSKRNSGL